MKYYLIYYGSFQIMIKDKIDDGDEQYASIFTNKIEAYEKLISELQEDRERWHESHVRTFNNMTRNWLKLLWKYEPDKISKLPAWYHTEVAEITENKVLL